jgi:hypothetical protein
MKQEPELLDIFAMFAMAALIVKNPKAHESDVAGDAYEYAKRMIEEKERNDERSE